ncbi:ABC transporter substrate-binding protein [Magnetospirillum molischianum]|nr:ABC transporter substrate-binding protein [Magnetospirillum molischianum]
MFRLAILSVLILTWGVPAWAGAKVRVMSIDNCANQLILVLADRDQIVSLAKGGDVSTLPAIKALAEGLPRNDRTAEEIIRARPDLLFYGTWTGSTAMTVKRLGIRAIRLEPPRDVAQAQRQIIEVATLLGQEERGRALAARVARGQDEAVARQSGTRLQGLVYRSGGYAYGADTLVDSIMDSAGIDNVAARLGQKLAGTIDMETVLMAAPQVLLDDQLRDRADPRIATDFLAHPALRRGLPDVARIQFPMAFWLCGGAATPIAIDALSALADAHRATLEGKQ